MLIGSQRLFIDIDSQRLLIRSMALLIGSQPGRLSFFGTSFRFPRPLYVQRMQTSHMSKTTALTPLDLSHLCTEYLRIQFQNKLNARSSDVTAAPLAQPLMLPVALASELDIIAATLVDAFFNRSQ